MREGPFEVPRPEPNSWDESAPDESPAPRSDGILAAVCTACALPPVGGRWPVSPRPVIRRDRAIKVPHVVVFKTPLFLFSGFLDWLGCIWSLFPRKQGAVGRMQQVAFLATKVLRVGGYFGRWYGGGGGLVPKWGRFEGVVLSLEHQIRSRFRSHLFGPPDTERKGAGYRVNLGTKLPNRTMG